MKFVFSSVLFLIFTLHFNLSRSQNTDYQNNIKGKVVDAVSKQPLVGVIVKCIYSDSLALANITDEEGNFKLKNVNAGRVNVSFYYVGYQSKILKNQLLTSGKELILDIEMEENISQFDEVEILANKNQQTNNEMTAVSARSFNVEETNKYAGSRQDPARMAGNFAGVQSTNDSRNDIVVRGNSPAGLIWRLEDVDIPNPNHFAVAGTSGGPLSIINNKSLSNSDFMTSAFPAEYGNGIAGVFDLKMKKGNTDKIENSLQLGILGLEAASEGPLSKSKKISYQATFRYSTFQAFQFINVPIGTSAVPKYLDWSYKVNIPTKKFGNFSVFGIGGKSKIDIVLSTLTEKPKESYGEIARDQYFKTDMNTIGAKNTFLLTRNSYINTVIAYSDQNMTANHDIIYRDMNYRTIATPKILGSNINETRMQFHTFIGTKINHRHSIKYGLNVIYFSMKNQDSARFDSISAFRTRANFNGGYFFWQPYIQYKYIINERLSTTLGLRAQVATVNQNSKVVEPRFGLIYKLNSKQTLSAGYGLHSQLQSNYIYFTSPNRSGSEIPNNQLGFTRSHHFVGAFNYQVKENLRVRIESYYQYVFDVPVYNYASSISLINQGSSFGRFIPKDQMVNKGTGENYGIELTVEKFFSKNYFIMFTTSIFNSTYKGSNGVKRNTDFNGKYVSNILAGYELPVGKKKKNTLIFGTKLAVAGGKRYSPADIDSSKKYLEYQPIDSLINTKKFKPYFRLDFRLGYRINGKNCSHELMFDLSNALNTTNLLALSYSPDPSDPTKDPITQVPQLKRLPLFYWKFDF